jgi:UDP:flavonoid glycosyltransferase YjiC (YdhE family)
LHPSIIFASPPEPGHILPTIPIARHLKELGYEVTYLTTNQFGPHLRSLGFRVELYLPEETPHSPTPAIYATRISGRNIWLQMLSGDLRRRGRFLQERLQDLSEKLRPRALIIDQLFSNHYQVDLSAFARKCPLFLLWTLLPPWNNAVPDIRFHHIVLCPDAFELPEFRRTASHVRYVEPSIELSRDEVKWESSRINQARKLVICTFGSQANRYAEIIERVRIIVKAARHLPHVEFAIGAGQSAMASNIAESSNVSNVLMHEFLPQLKLLPHSSLLVSHGGLGSVKEAVYMGVPLLILPFSYDQPCNAMRVRHHGIGEALFGKDITPVAVQTSISSILNSAEYGRRVKLMMKLFRQKQENPEAARWIHSVSSFE